MARLLTAIGAAVVVALVAWLVGVGFVLQASARPQLRRADAILVLGAAQYNGRPSPVLRARLDHALELYRSGLAPLLVFTGGIGVGDTLSEAIVARRYALERGIPDGAILTERHGVTSGESVEAAAALLRDRGLGRVLLVSDPFHMLRLQILARRAGLQAYRAPVPDSPLARSPATRWRYILRESLLVPATLVLGG